MIWLNPLFLIPIICGPIFILAGWIMLKFPPKKINGIYGYRTSSSMKSDEHWDFAQKYGAFQLIRWGAIMILSSSLGIFLNLPDMYSLLIALGLLVILSIFPIVLTERALRQKFKE
mgnify:CR=1 FL=1